MKYREALGTIGGIGIGLLADGFIGAIIGGILGYSIINLWYADEHHPDKSEAIKKTHTAYPQYNL